jgi:DNA-binding CsgD family transcriptional regulator
VGRCLGYAEDKASQSINNLYARHADEFGEDDTFIIKLMTNSAGNPNTRIFSHTGCIKLGFFAATAKAREFRAWAARVLAGEASAPVIAAGASIRVTRAVERQALELFVAGQSYKQIAHALGISVATVSLLVNGKYRFHPAAGPAQTSPALIEAVVARIAEREQMRIAQQYCVSMTNQALAAALDQMGRRMLAQLGAEG